MTRDFWKDGFTADQFRNCVTLVEGDAPQRLADRANAILKAEMKKIKWHEPNEGPITVKGMIALRDDDDGHHD